MILKIYDPQASIVKPRILSRMKDLGETFYVFFVILMISSMLGIVLEVTISPPIRYIFHFVTSHCDNWHLSVKNWNFGLRTLIYIMKHVFLVFRFRVLQPDFHGYFYSPKSDYKCDYTANIWFPDEQWVLSDTVRYIYNSNTAQNPGYYSYWHWIHNAAATTLNCLLSWMIELYCDVNPPPAPPVQLWLERDVYAEE